MEPTRLFDLPHYQLEKFPQEVAFADKRDGKWVTISPQEYINKSKAISRGLIRLGIQPGDKIAMISNNRSNWNICDIAIQQIGAISVPMYPTISASDYVFIFNNAGVKLCIVSDQELYDKVASVKSKVSTLEEIYSFEKLDGIQNWEELSVDEDASLDEEIQKRSGIPM